MIKFKNMWKSINNYKKEKRRIKEVKYSEINLNEYIVIDVRSGREYSENHLKGAINIPLPEIKKNIGRFIKDKNKKLLICCQVGARSAKAVGILESMGYMEVYNLKGGIENI